MRAASKKPPLPPPSKRTVSILSFLAVLVLLLAVALVSVTVLYFLQERKLQERDGIARKSSDILQRCNVSYAQLEEAESFKLLGCSEIQAYLENVTGSFTSLQQRYSDLMSFVSAGWNFYKGSFYFFSQEAKTWQEAEEACMSHGAHLTSVASKEEMEYLRGKTRGIMFWIGLTDQKEEGNWTWTDGTKYNHGTSFWHFGQPDNWHAAPEHQEDCVHLRYDDSQPWNDITCRDQYRWICKKVFS
ncbi:C-type lectin domain family 4 member F-like [Eublepharis macularius]|uniref:C-type lectin domain family 4 member F-like n=1 Tax=Eublepharis macularius TaxID=481883 RepID=A0AA97L8G3_EUBMA|nr:C-type lectin domain family 4 member F-like [Eublepharis macularius]